MKKSIFAFIVLAFVLTASICFARDLQVSWTNPDDNRVTGVYVYYGQTKQAVLDKTTQIDVQAPENAVVITDLVPGDALFIGATSHDANGRESVFSDIISTVVPPESTVIEIPEEAPREIILRWARKNGEEETGQ